MAIDVKNVREKLAAAVEAAVTAAGITAVVKARRSKAHEQSNEIHVTTFAVEPQFGLTGNVDGSQLDFALQVHATNRNRTEADYQTAEDTLDLIEAAITENIFSWYGNTPDYPWQECLYFRPSKRPPSPMDMIQWRLAGIYIRVIL